MSYSVLDFRDENTLPKLTIQAAFLRHLETCVSQLSAAIGLYRDIVLPPLYRILSSSVSQAGTKI